ncbi:hypothetical protein HBO32_05425 [Pseudomonas nitroreducens]|nr:hypothetical protein [Pseudomonas nitroreducens]
MAVHAVCEEVLDDQIRLVAALEKHQQILAVPLDRDVLRCHFIIIEFKKVLGTDLCLDLAAILERNPLGCIFGDFYQLDFFSGHLHFPYPATEIKLRWPA